MGTWDCSPSWLIGQAENSSDFAEVNSVHDTWFPLSTKTIQLFQLRFPSKVQSYFLGHVTHSFWGLHSFKRFWWKHTGCTGSSSSLVKFKFKNFFCDKSQLAWVPSKCVPLEKAAHSRNFSQRNVGWWILFTLLLGVFWFLFCNVFQTTSIKFTFWSA